MISTEYHAPCGSFRNLSLWKCSEEEYVFEGALNKTTDVSGVSGALAVLMEALLNRSCGDGVLNLYALLAIPFPEFVGSFLSFVGFGVEILSFSGLSFFLVSGVETVVG